MTLEQLVELLTKELPEHKDTQVRVRDGRGMLARWDIQISKVKTRELGDFLALEVKLDD